MLRARRRTALSGAALFWACAACALAAPAGDAKKLERQQAAELKEARELADKAASAKAQVSTLTDSLKGIADDRAATHDARARAEKDLEAVRIQTEADADALRRDRDALETLLIGLIGNEPPASAGPLAGAAQRPSAGPQASIAGFYTHALLNRVADKKDRIAHARALSELISMKRDSLAYREAALDQASAQTSAERAEAARERDAYLAESQAAAARSKALARQAKTLRDLAERAAAAQKKAKIKVLSVSAAGPRTAPAAGAVATRFGAPTKAGSPAQGVTIRTALGAKVVAPAESTVIFSGPFRSYGRVLILDQGNGYAMILTGLDAAFAEPGDKVAAGALVGQMRQSPTKAGGAQNAPELYFEVRQAGRPIDPERWLHPAG
jgi:murein hydrolase activator